MDWAKTTARRDKKHLKFGIWCILYKRFDSKSVYLLSRCQGSQLDPQEEGDGFPLIDRVLQADVSWNK